MCILARLFVFVKLNVKKIIWIVNVKKNNMDSPYYLKYSTPIAFLTLAKTSSDFARAFFDPSSNIL